MCGGWGGWSGLGGSREARWRYAGASCSIVQTCPCSPSLSPDKPGRLENRHTSLLPCGGKPGVFSFLPSSHSFFLLSPPCRFWKQVLPRGGTLPALAQNNQRLLRAAWHRASARPDRWSGRPFFISRGQGAGVPAARAGWHFCGNSVSSGGTCSAVPGALPGKVHRAGCRGAPSPQGALGRDPLSLPGTAFV